MKITSIIEFAILLPFVTGYLRRRSLNTACPTDYKYVGDVRNDDNNDPYCKHPHGIIHGTVCCKPPTDNECDGLPIKECINLSADYSDGVRPCKWQDGECKINPVSKGVGKKKGLLCHESDGYTQDAACGENAGTCHTANSAINTDIDCDRNPYTGYCCRDLCPGYSGACGEYPGYGANPNKICNQHYAPMFGDDVCEYFPDTDWCCLSLP